jgi:hypothetical protein
LLAGTKIIFLFLVAGKTSFVILSSPSNFFFFSSWVAAQESRLQLVKGRKRKSPGKPRLFLQSFEKNYFFLAAFLAVFLPPFFADFLAAFFLGAAFFAAFFAMVFGFEKFICDEVIKNYDTKEIFAIVFFNIGLLISMIRVFCSSHFNLDFSSSIMILFFVFKKNKSRNAFIHQ